MRAIILFLLAGCGTGVTSGGALPGIGAECEAGRCTSGAVCAHDNVCAEPGSSGTALVGSDCSATEECAFTLECASNNECSAADAQGTGATGDKCVDDDNCQSGFTCDSGACVDLEIPNWDGGPCPADAESDDEFRALFQIPDLPTSEPLDFFAMPFPNDLRLDGDGRPMLDGFPSPGEAAPSVDRLLGFVAEQTGWGLDPVVYFRFNKPHDLTSIKVLTTDATVHFASIDPDADDYGNLSAFEFFTRQSRNRYVCQNWLAVTTYGGRPLLPNHTYAVWLTKGITSGGSEVFRDDDFPVLMQEDRPTDLTDAKAFDRFQPFRDFVDEEGLSRGEIVAATVFTTGDPARDLRYTREVVESETTTVAVGELADCATSPCDLACGASASFTESHALVSIPDFTTAAGLVAFDDIFRPQVQGTSEVCAVLTVPTGIAPTAGWPVALWRGDLGGDAQDAVKNGIAEAFAVQGVATLAIDLPHHGDRKTEEDATAQWFPTESPGAWRGTLYQAFADGHILQRLAADPQLGLDADQIWVVGEGVGGDASIALLAWAKDLQGGVVGNPGGLLGQLAAERREPFDVGHALERSFADSNLSRSHPLVALLQQWLGPFDPAGSAEAMVREPATIAKHVFLVDGVEDTELSPDSRYAVLRAASLPTAGEVLEDYGQATTDYPVCENVTTDDGKRTAASAQVKAGHHALSENAAEQAAKFVSSGTGTSASTLRE